MKKLLFVLLMVSCMSILGACGFVSEESNTSTNTSVDVTTSNDLRTEKFTFYKPDGTTEEFTFEYEDKSVYTSYGDFNIKYYAPNYKLIACAADGTFIIYDENSYDNFKTYTGTFTLEEIIEEK